ncbi:hypothetical protein NUW58_g10820 [Xylaria curta]|uniref:Uncharacterized protein n=1 Tax=Xylaria curta TaxID=42375 RepID=A0ACC1MGM6_9PEZI|nr:hypothetical protein NUW58_g10820 [Xylaria curta]
MSRNRNILLRASLPIALGIGAGWLVIPVTMGNVSDLLWTYEKRFPAVASTHQRTREGIERAWYMTKVHAELGKNYVDEKTSYLLLLEDFLDTTNGTRIFWNVSVNIAASRGALYLNTLAYKIQREHTGLRDDTGQYARRCIPRSPREVQSAKR